MKTLILFLALCGTASAQGYPVSYFAPPVMPVAAPYGTYYPVARPTWVGNFLWGPIWVYQPQPIVYAAPQQQPQPPR